MLGPHRNCKSSQFWDLSEINLIIPETSSIVNTILRLYYYFIFTANSIRPGDNNVLIYTEVIHTNSEI